MHPPSPLQRALFGPFAPGASGDAARLVLRVVTGLSLAFAHGLRKAPPSEGFVETVGGMGFPAPELFAWGATAAELGGGILLAVGLLTRPAAAAIVGTMAVVTFLAHGGDPFGDRELGLLYGVIALYFAAAGSGRYSLDALIRRRTAPTPYA